MLLDEAFLQEQRFELGIRGQPRHGMSRCHQDSLAPRSRGELRRLPDRFSNVLRYAVSEVVRFADIEDAAVAVAEEVHASA